MDTIHEKHDHSQCPCGVVRCQEIKQGHENCKFDKIDPVTFFAPKPESFLTPRSASEPMIDLVSKAFKTLSLDDIRTLKSLEDSQLSAIAIQALGQVHNAQALAEPADTTASLPDFNGGDGDLIDLDEVHPALRRLFGPLHLDSVDVNSFIKVHVYQQSSRACKHPPTPSRLGGLDVLKSAVDQSLFSFCEFLPASLIARLPT
jgi:hypothetical protein